MKKKKYIQHGGKRVLAMAMSVAMAGSLMNAAMFDTKKVEATTTGIEEGFESDSLKGTFMGLQITSSLTTHIQVARHY